MGVASDEIVELDERENEGWWRRYSRKTGLTHPTGNATQRGREVERASEEIWQLSGLPLANSRNTRGLVVGSVQSGKTASMFAVAAKSLDEGIEIVVVLSGRSKLLQKQTLERLRKDLDIDSPGYLAAKARELLPQETDDELKSQYSTTGARMRVIARRKLPIIAVVLKHPDHIRAMEHFL